MLDGLSRRQFLKITGGFVTGVTAIASTPLIVQSQGVKFYAVYAQGDPGNGIGGYDLKSSADRAFAFDYNG
ncbi:hypothetical protein KBT16_17960, partial [Nostoc sp. CCCryo 231-06]|nr:hypothetical protein [Nostoc sp. CCCryo 231-06]